MIPGKYNNVECDFMFRDLEKQKEVRDVVEAYNPQTL